jgi:GNAT superfamily N-acetyltransferase
MDGKRYQRRRLTSTCRANTELPMKAIIPLSENVSLVPAAQEDLEALTALRIDAMRSSLERIGRFDPVRAKERFQSGFSAKHTRHIVCGQSRIGFVVVKPDASGLLLDHLYVRPGDQGRGVGASVLKRVFAEADAQGLALWVGALRGSDSNRFYLRHGFQKVSESEWDLYYLRAVQGKRLA